MSHENAFMTKDFEWREGKVFGRCPAGLLESLKNDDVIQVRLCSRFGAWGISARKGYLLFDIGDEARTPVTFTLPESRDKLLLAGADNVISLLRGHHCRLKVDCPLGPGLSSNARRLVNFANESSGRQPLLISKETFYPDPNALSAGSSRVPLQRVLVVVDAEHLPWEGTRAGIPLSWDRTVEDFWALEKTGHLNCPYHLLIRFGYDGAIYMHPAGREHLPILIFEPQSAEGSFLKKACAESPEQDLEKLKADLDTAFMAGLVASLAKESSLSIENLCETQMKEAVITGLQWCHRSVSDGRTLNLEDDEPWPWRHLLLETPKDPVFIPVSLKRQGTVNQRSSLILRTLPYASPAAAANEIIRKPKVTRQDDLLPYVPIAKFGMFVTADRREIDDFRKIAGAIEQYLAVETPNQPFTIAVFGRPGSGKSFGVEQVIMDIIGVKKEHILSFNLSQFQGDEQFESAFEKIACASGGPLPVVCFDEFDATCQHQPLYWLEHFQRRLASVPRKRAIYVFIGGTAETFDEFQLQPSPRVTKLEVAENHYRDGYALNEYPQDCAHLQPAIEKYFPPQNTVMRIMNFSTNPSAAYTELIKAFRWVRDTNAGRTGRLPILFFENIGESRDGEPLGWLKSFLSPMQDGEFSDPGPEPNTKGTHKLGRAIFVFMEGNMGHFEGFLDNPDMPDMFKNAKGPDFVSRLSGQVANARTEQGANADDLHRVLCSYKHGNSTKPLSLGVFRTDPTTRKQFCQSLNAHINIQGPNKVDDDDEMFVIRRAIMLRHMFEKRGLDGKFSAGSNVLNALLRVPRLRHGARSLETILAMSAIPADGQCFTEEHLPPVSQLKLHVDLQVFKEHLNATDGVGLGIRGGGRDERPSREEMEMEWIALRRGGGYWKKKLY